MPARRPRMNAWRRRFTRRVLGTAVVIQVPFVVLLAELLARRVAAPAAAALAVLGTLALNTPLLVRMVTRWWVDRRVSVAWVWLAETPYFAHAMGCLFVTPLAYVAIPLGVRMLAAVYLAGLALGVYATYVRRFWTVVNRVVVEVEGLPAELEGYRIVQLSDLHCGPYMPRPFYRHLARRASSLGGDAIVLTGDMIMTGTAYLPDVTDFVRGLRARDGVFASNGNHDYFGTDGVADAMRAGGARVLANGGALVAEERGGGLYLAAVDDNWTQRCDVRAALAGRPAGRPCVLLAHDPVLFPAVALRGDVDLVLSGHTHGGQLAFPFLARRFNFARLHRRHTAGLYRDGRTALYVHRGNGTSGPPARLGAAPELAVVELRRARAGTAGAEPSAGDSDAEAA